MKPLCFKRVAATVLLFLLTIIVSQAATRYVDLNSGNPIPPYTNWATAALSIQDAVDAAMTGDEILVTNGVYATGGRAVFGTMTNRVVVDKPVTVRSINGPEFTIIQGRREDAIRCVYLTNGAVLSGFTLTLGGTRGLGDYVLELCGGGVWCESTSAIVSNCVVAGNSASGGGGGVYSGTLNNCTLTGNMADVGGGALRGTLNNCTLTGNSATQGGGASYSTLTNCTLTGNMAYQYGGGTSSGSLNNCTITGNTAGDSAGGSFGGMLKNCTLTGNSATNYGGGANGSRLDNCTLTGNSAYRGGGASVGTLNKCTLTGNSAGWSGGGADQSTLNNCTLTGNSADWGGGGAYEGTLNNCTLTGNSANYGGGANGSTLNNCILYFNTTTRLGANYLNGTLNYCCTTPLPNSGVGNLSLQPQLASLSHLSATSPCRGAGSAAYSTGTDIDGEPWANPPSIGCDEYQAGAVTGALSAAISAASTNAAVGWPVAFTALIGGRTSASGWDFGDGSGATNQPYTRHAWSVPGDYPVVLGAYNESYPAGVSATVIVHVVAVPVHYVAAMGANPVPPYTNWGTAAQDIQAAVDASVPGALILVSNGVYATGGRAVYGTMTNRVTVDKSLLVRSVNGPQFTIIQGSQVPDTINGDGAIRCVYLTHGAVLSGFTLTNGATRLAGDFDREVCGGGLWCESASAIVSNCVVAGNSACNSGGGAYSGTLNDCTLTGNMANYGGGANYGLLNNCTLTGNSASGGGGAYGSTLNNCTLTSNSANAGGGANRSTLNNCILYFNTAAWVGANYTDESTLNYSCTTPLPAGGVGNFTLDPLFADQLAGNLRLQSNSPCINAGNNAYATNATDLDSNPRIAGGTVDVGAYEFPSPSSVLSYAWLPQYGLSTDGSADFTDPDGDGLNNWQEWRCGTDPTNALSALRLLTPQTIGSNVLLRWESVPGLSYFLERSTDFSATPRFLPLATNVSGQAGLTSFTDTNGASAKHHFYRIGVQ